MTRRQDFGKALILATLLINNGSLVVAQDYMASAAVAFNRKEIPVASSTSQNSFQVIPDENEEIASSSTSRKNSHLPFSTTVSVAGGSLLDKIGRMISHVFPELDESPSSSGTINGGLFGDADGGNFAWGGSTLEVVKTQASYLTRAAAFGPRIIEEDGLRGTLLPVKDFYTRKNGNPIHNNYGCPYKNGPGWREEEEGENNGGGGISSESLSTNSSKPPSDWIALIERGGGCSFISKVRVAQALNAKAVVVGDAPSPNGGEDDIGLSGRLVTMFAPGDTSDILIPSTFVTRPSYVDLIRLIDEVEDNAIKRKDPDLTPGLQVILWRDDILMQWPLLDLAFVLLMLPSFMTLITIIVHRIRLIRQRRRERAPVLAVENLPCLIWRGNGQPWEKVEPGAQVGGGSKGIDDEIPQNTIQRIKNWTRKRFISKSSSDMELGSGNSTSNQEDLNNNNSSSEAGPSQLPNSQTLKNVQPPKPVSESERQRYYSCDECAICLSEFVDGDLIRVLPCLHPFHLREIDAWLLKVKGNCPICKREISIPLPESPPLSTAVASPGIQSNSTETNNETTPLLSNNDHHTRLI